MTLARLFLSVFILSLTLGLTACMKTRAQIKGGNTHQAADQDENDAEPAATNPAKHAIEIEEIKNEVTRISGKIEEIDHHQRNMNFGELKEYTTRLDSRIAELEKNQLLVMSELKALKEKETHAAVVERNAGESSSHILAEATKLLSAKNFDGAAERFRAVLNRGGKGKEAAEAYYGLGECDYNRKDYKKAIVQYSKVQEAFAKSARVPASLYRIGLSFQHLNMPADAKGFFSEVVERYPKSAEAKKARAKVKE